MDEGKKQEYSNQIQNLTNRIHNLDQDTDDVKLYRTLRDIGEQFTGVLANMCEEIEKLEAEKQNRAKYSLPIPKTNFSVPITKTSIFSVITFVLAFPFLAVFYFPTQWNTEFFNEFVRMMHKPLIVNEVRETLPKYFNQIDSGYSQIFKFTKENSDKISFKFYAEPDQEVIVRVNSDMLSGFGFENSEVVVTVDGSVLKTMKAHQGRYLSKDLSGKLKWDQNEEAEHNMHTVGVRPIFDSEDDDPIFLVDVIVLVKDVAPKETLNL